MGTRAEAPRPGLGHLEVEGAGEEGVWGLLQEEEGSAGPDDPKMTPCGGVIWGQVLWDLAMWQPVATGHTGETRQALRVQKDQPTCAAGCWEVGVMEQTQSLWGQCLRAQRADGTWGPAEAARRGWTGPSAPLTLSSPASQPACRRNPCPSQLSTP